MKPISKIYSVYLLIILFILLANTSFSQIIVTHFNAAWNDGNDVRDWAFGMEDIQTYLYIDIGKDAELQKKHKVVVVPTIIIFKDGEEVKRYQADLSFKMVATKEDLQEYIDELLAEDY